MQGNYGGFSQSVTRLVDKPPSLSIFAKINRQECWQRRMDRRRPRAGVWGPGAGGWLLGLEFLQSPAPSLEPRYGYSVKRHDALGELRAGIESTSAARCVSQRLAA
jgi:hypothetical protein